MECVVFYYVFYVEDFFEGLDFFVWGEVYCFFSGFNGGEFVGC